MTAIITGFVKCVAASANGGVPDLVYPGIFITVCRIHPAFPGNVTWISNNLADDYKRESFLQLQIVLDIG